MQLKVLSSAQSSYLAQWARTINCMRFFGARKLFSKKYTHAEVVIIQPLPHAIYTKFLPKFSNLRHKTSSAPKIFAALL